MLFSCHCFTSPEPLHIPAFLPLVYQGHRLSRDLWKQLMFTCFIYTSVHYKRCVNQWRVNHWPSLIFIASVVFYRQHKSAFSHQLCYLWFSELPSVNGSNSMSIFLSEGIIFTVKMWWLKQRSGEITWKHLNLSVLIYLNLEVEEITGQKWWIPLLMSRKSHS